MQHNPHEKKHLKYITRLNVLILKLIHENKLQRVKPLQEFKEYIKKQLPGSYKTKING